jgi:hypothetical protein
MTKVQKFKAEKYEDIKGCMIYDPPDMVPLYYKITDKTVKISCEMYNLSKINYYLFKKNKDSVRRLNGVIFKYYYKTKKLTLQFEEEKCKYVFHLDKGTGTFFK